MIKTSDQIILNGFMICNFSMSLFLKKDLYLICMPKMCSVVKYLMVFKLSTD